jgi:hypothetical protein
MIGDDLSPFFVIGDFCAENDTLDGADIIGIFDAVYVVDGGGYGMSSTRPAYTVATASLPADVFGKLLVHKCITYRVEEHRPNGSGESVLILEIA